MPDPVASITRSTHPSPHADRVSLGLLFYGLCAGAAAWAAQLFLNYGLSSHPCFPSDTPLATPLPGWGGVVAILALINIAALLIALSGALVSWRNWRVTHGEVEGSKSQLVEAGEGRSRFIALWGVMASVGFFLATAFNTIAMIGVPLCNG